jgi:hypothetical protein
MANPRTKINAHPTSRWNSEVRLLAWLATCVSVLSFLFYYQRGETLLYGDAVAHINIARRVFDSKTPGLLQLGTVWLPLPHLLMIPFLISGEMWRGGAGGSIPSMVAYVFGVIGMFRLVRAILSRNDQPDGAPRVAAWIAAFVYAANPNLIYMQTTAMGESVYLAFFIWAVVYFGESMRGDSKALTKCGLCLAAACLTRYDGWFLAAAMTAAVILLTFLSRKAAEQKHAENRRQPTVILKFVLLASAAPILWLAYNGLVYRNPLEFENGPYSAKAIERKTQASGNPGHPGSGNLLLAGMYFVKSSEANMAENAWLQRLWILVGFAALVALALRLHSRQAATAGSVPSAMLPLLLLLAPVPFYALSVAYGGVPIFVPAWWPFTHYNVRYGLQLLPAFAACLAFVIHFAMRSDRTNAKLRIATLIIASALVIASYASIWNAGPVSLAEAKINMRARNQLERQLAEWLKRLPPDSTILMYLGDHVGALQQAGIPLRRVIDEGNHRVWKQPSDPDGLWERALANPAEYADYVVAFEGDPVWQAMQGFHRHELVEIHVTGQARASLYRTR